LIPQEPPPLPPLYTPCLNPRFAIPSGDAYPHRLQPAGHATRSLFVPTLFLPPPLQAVVFFPSSPSIWVNESGLPRKLLPSEGSVFILLLRLRMCASLFFAFSFQASIPKRFEGSGCAQGNDCIRLSPPLFFRAESGFHSPTFFL